MSSLALTIAKSNQLGHDITEDMAKEMISHVDQDGNGTVVFYSIHWSHIHAGFSY